MDETQILPDADPSLTLPRKCIVAIRVEGDDHQSGRTRVESIHRMYSFDSRESSNEIRNGEATLVAIRVRQPEGRLAENAEVRVEEKDSATVCQEIHLQVRTLDAFRTAL
jgi:hypothetical protein